jgi:hypothetical protein
MFSLPICFIFMPFTIKRQWIFPRTLLAEKNDRVQFNILGTKKSIQLPLQGHCCLRYAHAYGIEWAGAMVWRKPR